MNKLVLVFSYTSVDVTKLWDALYPLLSSSINDDQVVDVFGEEMKFMDIERNLSEESFSLKSENLSINYTRVGRYKHDAVRLKTSLLIDWGELVRDLSDVGIFTQGYLVDAEYDFWQNAVDTLQYEVAGKDFSHLPMVSNGLPKPLSRNIIDISENPGRRVLKNGYIEAIGSPMWFTDEFWRLTGSQMSKVCSVAGVRCVVEDGITVVSMLDGRVDEASNESTLKNLRCALYP
ncbi:hypothetical protein SAMN02745181_2901 [Rubritalea squalenifaciens DSM 18772]|uniref:Uncharacterized protein n=1 Tax=Rubritalea squalenifaciens DSM 18772 TaxID=1123071 RepID=A0A1M6NMJ0_9BACT|nr:hypothetical protein [Rubritalea squalenifaciens]SHJ96806.1 hypothetical protein SAMN02745181_2901 [Rubritalea squalenifaciens DSM 18772]